jgi:hypothetical protein
VILVNIQPAATCTPTSPYPALHTMTFFSLKWRAKKLRCPILPKKFGPGSVVTYVIYHTLRSTARARQEFQDNETAESQSTRHLTETWITAGIMFTYGVVCYSETDLNTQLLFHCYDAQLAMEIHVRRTYCEHKSLPPG